MRNLNKEELMLAKLDQVMRQLRRRPAGKQNLGRGVFRIIRRVQNQENISTRELAKELGVRPSSLNEKLARLEREGIIKRERDSRDQRVFLIRLLPAGDELIKEMKVERKKMHNNISKILTADEMDTLTSLADKLAQGLSDLNPEDA